MLPRLITVAAGLWLVFSPAVLGYDDPAQASDRVVGPVIAGAAFVAIWEVVRAVRWVALPFAFWLLIAPWVFDYPFDATISSFAVGLVTVALTPWGRADPGKFGGGWGSLWGDAPT